MSFYVNKFEEFLETTGETGFVELVVHPIVRIRGLPSVRPKEVVLFKTGELGRVLSILSDYVEVLLFSRNPVAVGTQVTRTNKMIEIPVGKSVLGHVIDSLGYSVYKTQPVRSDEYRPVDVAAPGIESRSKVTESLETGVIVVDLMVPLGKGQRELVVGDRKVGKSQFLLQVMLSQAVKGSVCIYAAVGKKRVDINHIVEFAKKNDILDKMVVLASSASDSLGMIYLTPYSAMTLAEYFRDQGQDVLLILDDLTTHAKYYREISLLGRRFPGRDSYPGDIFYTHSKLLERAGNFKHKSGTVSITCLPVAESIEGSIVGYIQTNLMSITDGHIFFDKAIFSKGRRPAINYFLSVTRVGRQTQTPLRWGVNRELSSFLSLSEKTERFVHFGAEINQEIRSTLLKAEKIHQYFNQSMSTIVLLPMQLLLFGLIWIGKWAEKTGEEMEMDFMKLMELYQKDDEYKRRVDELVESAKDFNAFLGKLSKDAQIYLDVLE